MRSINAPGMHEGALRSLALIAQSSMKLSLSFALLLSSCGLHAAQWSTIVEPANQIFPALEIASAKLLSRAAKPANLPTVLGDQHGLIGIRIKAERANQRVHLQVSAPEILQTSTLSVVLPNAGQNYELYPAVRWRYAALAKVRAARPVNLHFELQVDAKPNEKKTQRVQVRSLNDALFSIADERGNEALDFNWLFAAYVNEHSPVVEQIVAAALQDALVEEFDGYATGDDEQVYAQVFAIWNALQRRGISYSNLLRVPQANRNVLSQHVRFVEESWRNAQANCVDGSVLLASVLRKIGIAPTLVLLPGHMLLGFALDESGQRLAYLETTMLGGSNQALLKGAHGARNTRASVSNKGSFDSFEAALNEAQKQVNEAGNAFHNQRRSEYQMIDVQAARERGVVPIVPR